MTKITFELTGVERFEVNLAKYNAEFISDLERIVLRGTQAVVRNAKNRAPNDSGNLRASLRQKDVSRRLGMSHKLARTVTARGRKGNHLHLVTLGTRERIVRSTGRRTGRMTANPFLAQAEQGAQMQVSAQIRERVVRKVEI